MDIEYIREAERALINAGPPVDVSTLCGTVDDIRMDQEGMCERLIMLEAATSSHFRDCSSSVSVMQGCIAQAEEALHDLNEARSSSCSIDLQVKDLTSAIHTVAGTSEALQDKLSIRAPANIFDQILERIARMEASQRHTITVTPPPPQADVRDICSDVDKHSSVLSTLVDKVNSITDTVNSLVVMNNQLQDEVSALKEAPVKEPTPVVSSVASLEAQIQQITRAVPSFTTIKESLSEAFDRIEALEAGVQMTAYQNHDTENIKAQLKAVDATVKDLVLVADKVDNLEAACQLVAHTPSSPDTSTASISEKVALLEHDLKKMKLQPAAARDSFSAGCSSLDTAALSKKIHHIEQQIIELGSSVHSTVYQSDTVLQRLSLSERGLQEVTSNVRLSSSTLNVVQQRVSCLEEDVADFRDTGLKRRLDDLEQQRRGILDLSSQSASFVEQLQQRVSIGETHTEKLTEKLKEIESERQQSSNEMTDEMQKLSAHFERDITSLYEKVADSEKHLVSKLSALHKRIETTAHESQDFNNDLSGLTAGYGDVQKTLTQLIKRVDKSDAHTTTLQLEVTSTTNSVESLKERTQLTAHQLQQHATVREVQAEHSAQVSLLQADVKQLRSRCTSHDSTIEGLAKLEGIVEEGQARIELVRSGLQKKDKDLYERVRKLEVEAEEALSSTASELRALVDTKASQLRQDIAVLHTKIQGQAVTRSEAASQELSRSVQDLSRRVELTEASMAKVESLATEVSNRDLGSVKDSIAQLAAEVSHIGTEVRCKASAEDVISQGSELKSRLSETEQALKALGSNTELSILSNNYNDLLCSTSQLMKRIEHCEQQLVVDVGPTAPVLQTLQEEVTALSGEVDKLRVICPESPDDLYTGKREFSQFTNQSSRTFNELALAIEDVSRVQTRLKEDMCTRASDRFNDLVSKVSALHKRIEATAHESQDFNNDLSGLTAGYGDVQKTLTQLIKRVDRSDAHTTTLQLEVTSTTNSVESLKERTQLTAHQQAIIQNTSTEHTTQVSLLQAEVKQLRAKFSSHDSVVECFSKLEETVEEGQARVEVVRAGLQKKDKDLYERVCKLEAEAEEALSSTASELRALVDTKASQLSAGISDLSSRLGVVEAVREDVVTLHTKAEEQAMLHSEALTATSEELGLSIQLLAEKVEREIGSLDSRLNEVWERIESTEKNNSGCVSVMRCEISGLRDFESEAREKIGELATVSETLISAFEALKGKAEGDVSRIDQALRKVMENKAVEREVMNIRDRVRVHEEENVEMRHLVRDWEQVIGRLDAVEAAAQMNAIDEDQLTDVVLRKVDQRDEKHAKARLELKGSLQAVQKDLNSRLIAINERLEATEAGLQMGAQMLRSPSESPARVSSERLEQMFEEYKLAVAEKMAAISAKQSEGLIEGYNTMHKTLTDVLDMKLKDGMGGALTEVAKVSEGFNEIWNTIKAVKQSQVVQSGAMKTLQKEAKELCDGQLTMEDVKKVAEVGGADLREVIKALQGDMKGVLSSLRTLEVKNEVKDQRVDGLVASISSLKDELYKYSLLDDKVRTHQQKLNSWVESFNRKWHDKLQKITAEDGAGRIEGFERTSKLMLTRISNLEARLYTPGHERLQTAYP